MFAMQVARALGDVAGEMVTEVFPTLHSLIFISFDPEELQPAEQFASLRRRYERRVTTLTGPLRCPKKFQTP